MGGSEHREADGNNGMVLEAYVPVLCCVLWCTAVSLSFSAWAWVRERTTIPGDWRTGGRDSLRQVSPTELCRSVDGKLTSSLLELSLIYLFTWIYIYIAITITATFQGWPFSRYF